MEIDWIGIKKSSHLGDEMSSSSLYVSESGKLKIVGRLEHGHYFEPSSLADCEKLQRWLEEWWAKEWAKEKK